jgi:signal transduction histidine kinase
VTSEISRVPGPDGETTEPEGSSPRVRWWWRRHPRGTDAAVCLAFALCALLTVALFMIPSVIWYTYPPGSPMALRVTVMGAVVAVAGTGLLWWRRRFPITVAFGFVALALLSLLLTGGSGAAAIGLALAAYAVAASRGSLITWAVVVAAWAVMAVTHVNLLSVSYVDLMGLGWLETQPGHLAHPPGGLTPETWTGTELAPVTSDTVRLSAVITIAALLLLAVALGTNARLRRQHAENQRERERTLRREEQQRALLTRATERTHIAREVHDVIAHSVSVMVALADGATAVAATSPEEAQVAMREVSQTGRAALADMKRVLLALDDAPAATGDDEDLATTVSRFRLAGVPVTATGLDTAVPQAAIALALRRILAESLTNVLRHAPGAEEVSVAVERSDEAVMIEVTNSASGGSTAVGQLGAGRGLTGMRERAERLGGTVEAGPVARGGWRVGAVLPMRLSDQNRTAGTATEGAHA